MTSLHDKLSAIEEDQSYCCLGMKIPGYGHSRNCKGPAGYFSTKLGTVILKPKAEQLANGKEE